MVAANRNRFSDYFEVFIDAPLDQLQARDGKGLYKSANAGPTRNVVGVDIPFPVPEAPDLRINNSGPSLDGEATAGEILLKMGV